MEWKSCFEAVLFDELMPLYPDTDVKTGSRLHKIAAASGTYAGVHILMDGLTPGKCVTVEVIPPVRKGMATGEGEASVGQNEPDYRFKLFELLPLPVEVNTGTLTRTEWQEGEVNADVIRRAPFTVYDVLRPCTSVVTAQGAVMAMAFRCRVDADKKELKKWEIIVTHDGISRRLTFEAEVFPVVVPDCGAGDHKYVNWLDCKAIASYHKVSLLSDEWFEIFEKYLRLGRYGRQNMVLLPAGLYFELKDGRAVLKEETLDRLIAVLDKVGIYWIEGGHFARRKDGEWMADTAELKQSRRQIPGDGEAELADMCSGLYCYLKKRGLTGRWFQSFMDEPIDCLAEAYAAGTRVIRTFMPGIPVLDATISREAIAGAVDYWCPTINKYEKYRDFFDERHEKGEHILVYTCLEPAGNFCNRLLDQERLRQVWIGWAPACYDNIEGYLHWGGMSMDRLDYLRLSAPLPDITDYESSRRTVLPAGDPAIMFPGFYEVYSSTRLEAHRIGFEDLVLLERVRAQDPGWVKELVSAVFCRYDKYEKDVARYRQARRRLLEKASEYTAE